MYRILKDLFPPKKLNEKFYEEESQKLMMINRHKVFFWGGGCIPIFSGMASSPGLFQCIIDQLIQGIPKTTAYINNILISDLSMVEHNTI